ncbi:MAG: aminoacyl-tRNA hydrolase [bacterium]
MRVLFGIGNPGIKYQHTWHNAGFIILDKLAHSLNLKYTTSKYNYIYSKGTLNNSDFIIVKPTTYVNNSGLAALQILKNFEIELKDFLVICDDLNIDKGLVKIKKNGGDGGHNGLYSLIYHLNSNEFPRLRLGIGSQFEKGNMADYVLSEIGSKDYELIEKSLDLSVLLLNQFIIGGLDLMLNSFSRNKNKLKNEL